MIYNMIVLTIGTTEQCYDGEITNKSYLKKCVIAIIPAPISTALQIVASIQTKG